MKKFIIAAFFIGVLTAGIFAGWPQVARADHNTDHTLAQIRVQLNDLLRRINELQTALGPLPQTPSRPPIPQRIFPIPPPSSPSGDESIILQGVGGAPQTGSGQTNQTTSTPTSATAEEPKFEVGDEVYALDNLKVRATPSMSGTLVTTVNAGAVGIVAEGPVSANGLTWWNINWTGAPDVSGRKSSSQSGSSGWSADLYLDKTENSQYRVGATVYLWAVRGILFDFLEVAQRKTFIVVHGGESGTLLEGPIPLGVRTWWKVNFGGRIGWITQGLLTLVPPTPVTVGPIPVLTLPPHGLSLGAQDTRRDQEIIYFRFNDKNIHSDDYKAAYGYHLGIVTEHGKPPRIPSGPLTIIVTVPQGLSVNPDSTRGTTGTSLWPSPVITPGETTEVRWNLPADTVAECRANKNCNAWVGTRIKLPITHSVIEARAVIIPSTGAIEIATIKEAIVPNRPVTDFDATSESFVELSTAHGVFFYDERQASRGNTLRSKGYELTRNSLGGGTVELTGVPEVPFTSVSSASDWTTPTVSGTKITWDLTSVRNLLRGGIQWVGIDFSGLQNVTPKFVEAVVKATPSGGTEQTARVINSLLPFRPGTVIHTMFSRGPNFSIPPTP